MSVRKVQPHEPRVMLSRWIHYLIQFGVQGPAELHVLHQVGALALVRGNDANLVGFSSSLQQPGSDLLNVGSLGPKTKSNQQTVLIKRRTQLPYLFISCSYQPHT